MLPYRLSGDQDRVEGAQHAAAEEYPTLQAMRSGDAENPPDRTGRARTGNDDLRVPPMQDNCNDFS